MSYLNIDPSMDFNVIGNVSVYRNDEINIAIPFDGNTYSINVFIGYTKDTGSGSLNGNYFDEYYFLSR